MSQSLISTLAIFGIYSLAGFVPLYAAYKSTSRFDRLSAGFFLIYFAAFVLTSLALVTGVAENLAGIEALKMSEKEQLSEFMQYIIFFGFIFTLLFGSVGANIFTSALIQNDNSEIIKEIRRVERNTKSIEEKVEFIKTTNKGLLALNIILVLVGLIIIYKVW